MDKRKTAAIPYKERYDFLVRIRKETHTRLKRAAESQNRQLWEVAEEAFQDWLKKNPSNS